VFNFEQLSLSLLDNIPASRSCPMFTSQNRTRNWKEIARELASEENPTKCIALSLELNQAITEEFFRNRRDGDSVGSQPPAGPMKMPFPLIGRHGEDRE
jgi:hypothetical protein